MDRTQVGLAMLSDLRMAPLEQVDQALADRVSARLSLSHFKNDGVWAGFLGELIRSVSAVDLTALGSADLLGKLHQATKGNRRSLARLVVEVVMVTVDQGEAKASAAACALAFQRVAGPAGQVANPFEAR